MLLAVRGAGGLVCCPGGMGSGMVSGQEVWAGTASQLGICE